MAIAPAELAKIVELLQALSSSDNAARQKAETLYQQAKKSEPDKIMIGMMAVLSTQEVDENVRRHDAVLLRQMVTGGAMGDSVFARLSPQHRSEVAAELLVRFEREPAPKIQKKIGEVITKLAEYVCDKGDQQAHSSLGAAGWPALLPLTFRLADPATCTSEDSCESAMRLMWELVPTIKDEIVAARQTLEQIIQRGFAHASLKIRTCALLLVCEIIQSVEKQAWAPLMVTAGVMVQVLQQLATSDEDEFFQSAVQSFIEVATVEPDFFKVPLSQTLEPAKFMSSLATAREGVEPGMRNLALEWLVSYLEKRTKWLTKHVKGYLPLVLESCMQLMLEIDDGEEELKAWAEHEDNEEGEEDEDELFHAGAEAIDRVVQVATIGTVGSSLFEMITRYAGQDSWQAKHAALTAVKQSVEYVEETEHINQMAHLCLQHMDHPHPRVRYTALHAIGQIANDQSPHFQEANYQKVMPVLMARMDDGVDRVVSMAMSSFTTFGEGLDNSFMLQYAQGFMEKLCAKLQATQHQGVREESITCIGVIAGVIEKDFSLYYDTIMPVLKQIVMHAVGEKENRLRGKSFECMSLLGLAVGKEKFLPDAREAVAEMMKIPLEADDIQREYIKEASERICQCLKKDFAPFMPSLLPRIFQTIKLEEVKEDGQAAPKPVKATDDDSDDDDDDYVQVTTGEGKLVQVKTSQLEDMVQSVQLLHTFITEMEGAYYDCVPMTAEALAPLLSSADELACWCDELQSALLQTWALLIKVARTGAEERGLPGTAVAAELLRTCLKPTFALFENSQEADQLAQAATGIADCIKNAGPGILSAEEVKQVVGKLFTLMDQSLQRTQVEETLANEDKAAAKRALQHIAEEDDDDKDSDTDEEEQLRRNCEEVLGALMQVNSSEFLPLLEECGRRLTAWIGAPHSKVVAMYLGCDLVEHLKENSEPLWPCLMPEVFNGLGSSDADARIAAAYAVNLAAPLASFSQAAGEAFRRLAVILGGKGPGKRDTKGRLAVDNAVAAMLTLAKEKPSCCPPDIQAWQLVLSRLPLKSDEEEGQKVHQKLVDLVIAEHDGLLGGPGTPNLGKVLSVLAEVYRNEDICTKETDEKILLVFKRIPKDVLMSFAGGFSEKQQKKIEKMILG